MAEPDQPKKETVRIEVPHPPVTPPPPPSAKPRETVRIQLPVRETGNAPVPSSPPEDISSTNFFPSPKPPAATRPLSTPVRPPSIPPSLGPKKETVRIPLQEPLGSAQKKTQPLMAMPNVIPENPPIAVAPVEKSSMLTYWMLLAMSALILIIQIWTYFS
jgi:hypothetical protein